MISLISAIITFALVVAWQLVADWWQRRASIKRRRALESRFRREIFEGRMTLPLHRGTPWYEQPDEQELMDRKGITFEDVQTAMRELRK